MGKIIYCATSEEVMERKYSSVSPFLRNISVLSHLSKAYDLALLWLISKRFSKPFFDSRPSVTEELRPSVVRVLKKLLDERVIEGWHKISLLHSVPPMNHYALGILPQDVDEAGSVYLNNSLGEGTGPTKDIAMIKAIAETLERQSVMVWKKTDLYDSRIEHGSKQQLIPYKELSNYRELTRENASIKWVRARGMFGECVLVPAAHVYMGYESITKDMFQTGIDVTTNGVAAGTTYVEAALAAIYEAVERHALMNAWMKGIAPEKVDLNSLPGELHVKYSKFIQYKIDVHVLKLKAPLDIPTYCVVAYGPGVRKVVMSAASGFTHYDVLDKVYYETLKHLHSPGVRQVVPYEAGDLRALNYDSLTESDTRALNTLKQRQALLENITYADKTKFFVRGETINCPVDRSDTIVTKQQSKDRLNNLCRDMQKLGATSCLTEVSSPVATSSGLKVVRFISDWFIPLFFDFEKEKKYLQEYIIKDSDSVTGRNIGHNIPIPFI